MLMIAPYKDMCLNFLNSFLLLELLEFILNSFLKYHHHHHHYHHYDYIIEIILLSNLLNKGH